MATKPQLPLQHVLSLARARLGMSQREFGPALLLSHRTASRWDTGRAVPDAGTLRHLATLLVPVDLALAQEVAAHANETLEELGLVAPAPPPQAPRPPVTAHDLVDAVLCAGAEASDASPRALRPVLHAAFRRARELGLTVDEVEAALASANKDGKRAPPE
jgi:transcriptional regulator with XRE-family HTH domain